MNLVKTQTVDRTQEIRGVRIPFGTKMVEYHGTTMNEVKGFSKGQKVLLYADKGDGRIQIYFEQELIKTQEDTKDLKLGYPFNMQEEVEKEMYPENRNVCPRCGKKFKNYTGMAVHLKRFCGDQKGAI
jgi:hypothetical protein